MILAGSQQVQSLSSNNSFAFSNDLDSWDQEDLIMKSQKRSLLDHERSNQQDPERSNTIKKVMATIDESILSGELIVSSELISSKRTTQKREILTADQALNKAGGGNRYQLRTLMLLALQQTIQAFILQGQPFLFMSPDFQCYKNPSTKEGPYKCQEQKACLQQGNSPDLQPNTPETLVVYFHLYCDQKYYISLTQTIYFAISNFSILIFSALADKFGRRPIIVICYIIGAFPILAGGFSPNILIFMTLFIISGIGISPYAILVFVLMQENSNDAFRQKTTVYLLMTWGIGQILFIPIAYYFPQWDILIIYFIGVPLCIQVFSFLIIYESVKWLVVSRNYNRARTVLLQLAKVNKQSESVIDYLQSGFTFTEEQQEITIKEDNALVTISKQQPSPVYKKYSILDLFRYKSTRSTTISLCLIYFGIYMQYFGAIFALSSLGGNKYINAAILNSTELAAYILAVPVVNHLKRKHSFPAVFLVMTLCSLVFFFFGNNPTVNLIMAVFAKVCISISFSISYVYAPELFPTPIRGIGIGFCTFFGKFGAALAPIVILISQSQSIDINPMASFGIFLFIAFLLSLFLKETKGSNLQDQIPEIEQEASRKASALS